MARAVRFDRYGGIGELKVIEVPTPVPGPGEVLVEVVATSINPGEAAIRTGALRDIFPATFPSGQGSDFAGRVSALGSDVTEFAVGTEVIGFTDRRAAHATHVAVGIGQVSAKPEKLDWDTAGSLYVAGTTAYAAIRATVPQSGETVVVSGAAGGVGSITVQLLRARDVRVVGIASEHNHEWLASQGAVPVSYDDGVIERIRWAAPDGVDAFIDTVGADYVDMAIELGVSPERIDTITNMAAARKYGAKTDGNAAAGTIEVLAELARLAAQGVFVVPIAAVYSLDRVREAFALLEKRHTRGKIVLHPGTPADPHVE